jgi:hypothetical protein
MLAIHKNLTVTVNVSLKENEIMRGRLHEPPWRRRAARYSGGQAVGLGIVLRFAGLHERFRPRQQDHWIAGFQPLGNIARIAEVPMSNGIMRLQPSNSRLTFVALPSPVVASSVSSLNGRN